MCVEIGFRNWTSRTLGADQERRPGWSVRIYFTLSFSAVFIYRRTTRVITAKKKKKKSIRFGRGMRILFIRMINSGTRVVYAGACGGNPQ